MDIAHGRDLTVGLIQRFLHDGWEPDPVFDEAEDRSSARRDASLQHHDSVV